MRGMTREKVWPWKRVKEERRRRRKGKWGTAMEISGAVGGGSPRIGNRL